MGIGGSSFCLVDSLNYSLRGSTSLSCRSLRSGFAQIALTRLQAMFKLNEKTASVVAH